MRATALLFLALVFPAAAAMPPTLEVAAGHATTRAFLANANTVCLDSGNAALVIQREMEAATFQLAVESVCVPTLTFRGVLAENGWAFHGAMGLQSGAFTTHDGGETWHLQASLDTCPELVACVSTHGIRIAGQFARPDSLG